MNRTIFRSGVSLVLWNSLYTGPINIFSPVADREWKVEETPIMTRYLSVRCKTAVLRWKWKNASPVRLNHLESWLEREGGGNILYGKECGRAWLRDLSTAVLSDITHSHRQLETQRGKARMRRTTKDSRKKTGKKHFEGAMRRRHCHTGNTT
jgi:hypothetical protein